MRKTQARFRPGMMRRLLFIGALLIVTPAFADLDLVFVIDTTGSMGGELREVQERVRQLATSMTRVRTGERLRFGIVAYRDRGDDYVTKNLDLTESVEEADAFLSSLSAGGGGDGPESVIAGLDAALHQMSWNFSEGIDRQIFLIGDAPPHLDYSGEATPEELSSEAVLMKIVINTIGCRSLPPPGVRFFRSMAYATEGSYQHIGRVRNAASGELTEAVGRTIAESSRSSAAAGRELPTDWLEHREAESSAILVRQGGPEGIAQSRESEGLSPCTLSILLPNGFALSAPPVVRLLGGRLRVELALTDGPGGLDIFALKDCPDPTTPIDIITEGS